MNLTARGVESGARTLFEAPRNPANVFEEESVSDEYKNAVQSVWHWQHGGHCKKIVGLHGASSGDCPARDSKFKPYTDMRTGPLPMAESPRAGRGDEI